VVENPAMGRCRHLLKKGGQSATPDPGFLQFRVNLLQSRQETDDSTLWQAPGLALAPQAFLLTNALADKATRFGRITSAVLALCTAGAAIYLIMRKRAQRKVAEAELKDVVQCLYVGEVVDISIEDRARTLSSTGRSQNMLRYVRLDAQIIWAAALVIFTLVDVLIVALAWSNSPWLGTY
jgi:nitrogen fixation/metabolism regulation signal transduction histidine kinase